VVAPSGPIGEGEYWLQAFAADTEAPLTLATVRACTARQVLREAMGDFPAALVAAEEGLRGRGAWGDDAALAFALCWLLEAAAVASGGLKPVIDLCEEATAAVENTGDQYLRALLACQASFFLRASWDGTWRLTWSLFEQRETWR
jgi:hypothetical protein